jgi:D-hexose-6-phosphate mutarotase
VDPASLETRFGVGGLVRFEPGQGGLPRAVATVAGTTAHAYLHGGHVTHFQPASSGPVLFTSPRSAYTAGRAIRGGVPVIFPWFGPHPDDPRRPDHGFARTAEWMLESVEATTASVALELALEPDESTRALWPQAFRLRYRVEISRALEMTLAVENCSSTTWTYEEALHTYLHVGDVEAASVQGLEDVTYIDKADGMARKRQGRDPVRVRGLTDRVYLGTEASCVVDDPVLARRLQIDKRGSRTTVIWNPGLDAARAMGDLGPEAWRSMLCVETANASADAVRLEPGQRHEMTARIAVVGEPGGPSPA